MKYEEMPHKVLVSRLSELAPYRGTPTELYRKLGAKPADHREFWPRSPWALGNALGRLEERDDLSVWITRHRSNGARIWEVQRVSEPAPVTETAQKEGRDFDGPKDGKGRPLKMLDGRSVYYFASGKWEPMGARQTEPDLEAFFNES